MKHIKVWEHGMQVLDTHFKQRVADGKWERIIKVRDYTNKYVFFNENGVRSVIVPEKWYTVGVYDFIAEYADAV